MKKFLKQAAAALTIALFFASASSALACPTPAHVTCNEENDGAYASENGKCSQCQEQSDGSYAMVPSGCVRGPGCKGGYAKPEKKSAGEPGGGY